LARPPQPCWQRRVFRCLAPVALLRTTLLAALNCFRWTSPYLGLYSSSKFALEGMIEGLYHELRPFHIRVSLVEPTFFRTKFDARPPAAPLAVYESARQSMMRFVRDEVEQGPDPEQVARRIVQLATSAAPPLRSYVGPRAGLLVALRRWLPQRIFEQVRRRVFQIQRVPDFDGKAHPVMN